MKTLTYFLLTTLFLALFTQQAKASHAMGGELVYESLGNNQYKITLYFYRDCEGIAAPNSATVNLSSSTTNFTVNLQFLSVTQLSTSCQGLTTCNGGAIPGFEQYVYEGTVTLPSTENFEVSYALCCRNAAITNLTNPDTYEIYLTTNINNSLVPSNNSPHFINLPTIVLFSGMPATLQFNTIDTDGDSLSYEMVQPLDEANAPIAYVPGFTVNNPLNTSTPLVFDPLTGRMEFTPSGVQSAVLSVLVREHRFGQIISTTRRDIQCIVMNTNNASPLLNTVNATPVNGNLYVCIGDVLDFDVMATDPDNGQVLAVTTNSTSTASININNNNSAQVGVNYNWAPTANDVSAQPYFLNVTAADNGCPPVSTTNTYQIYVTNCSSDVWPGDANADFVADHYDILNIGRGWNHAGAARAGASTNWVAQPASDWQNAFPSGLNHKHGDCNGDGTIDSLDLDVITLNFGQTHLKDQAQKQVGVPLSIATPTGTFTHGETVNFPVSLGTSAEPANSVYGVAFTVNYDENMFDASSFDISFDNNWLANGNGEAITYFNHNELDGTVDIAISRNDQTDISGLGELCNISLTLKDNLPFAYVVTDLTVRGSVLEDYAENSLDVSELDAEVTSAAPEDTGSVGINELALQLGVYPNPANSSLTVTTNVQLSELTIYNLAGQQVLNVQTPNTSAHIDIADLQNGVYILSGETTDGKRMHTRFVKMGLNR